jgi:neutral ceramidase
MWLKRIFRFLLYFICALLAFIVVFLAVTVIPVDRTLPQEQPFYKAMMDRLDSLKDRPVPSSSGKFIVGYNVSNLTPSFPVATAGYGNRLGKKITAVHDSVFVRSIVIDNGKERVAIVSADLLIIPPTVTEVLKDKLKKIGFSLDNTYLNATHTHNSIGNWAEGAAGIIYGAENDAVVEFISDKIVTSISAAAVNGVESEIKYGSISVPNAVRHRIDGVNGHVDSLLRVVEFTRHDSSKLVLVSFNAHPTCLFSKDLELSRDYPGELVDGLERSGYDFAMFLSGAVGSHGCNPPEYGKPCLTWMANEILSRFDHLKPSLVPGSDSVVRMMRVPLELGEPQIKITRDLRLRPWVFRSALGEYQPYLTSLRLGEILFLGTPCDFAGELRAPIDSAAARHNLQPIITSFNGQYIGYITNDIYYDNPHYETRLMNWYGPGNGAYISKCMTDIVDIMAR